MEICEWQDTSTVAFDVCSLSVVAGAPKAGGCLGSVVPGLLGGEFSMVGMLVPLKGGR